MSAVYAIAMAALAAAALGSYAVPRIGVLSAPPAHFFS